MTRDDYIKLAAWLKTQDLPDHYEAAKQVMRCHVFTGAYEEAVPPKERPRVGGKGGVFTPKKTRDFEASVRSWASDIMDDAFPPLFPVKVTLTLFDAYPQSLGKKEKKMAMSSLIFRQVGDIDNKAKAVLDAVNGVVFADDRQINDLTVSRRYSENDGFVLNVHRSGLSKAEAEQLVKFL